MPQAPPIPAPAQTLAIVLGASEWPLYPDFQEAPSFRKSLKDLADYLRDPQGLGLPARNVRVLIDSHDEAPEILRDLRRFLRDRTTQMARDGAPATDLLFYYVGHGGFSGSAFFLSIRATDAIDPLGTSITADSLGRLIREGAAGLRSYLVLDCCFAAAVSDHLMSAPLDAARLQLEDKLPEQGDDSADAAQGQLPGYGVALLCAAGKREPAQAPGGEAHTMFSGALLALLREGEATAPPFLSLGDLEHFIRRRLAARFAARAVLPELHLPQQRQGRLDRVRLFRNPARTAAPNAGTPETEASGQYLGRYRRLTEVSAPPASVGPTLPALGPKQAFWASGRAPEWALEWGTDAYGHWASFLVPSAAGPPLTPRMRWAPPGWFMMGSPNAAGWAVERPQHLVTFAQGFWIFETACTEELWQAVTGKAPDPRRGPTFPVTGVSWNDTRSFVGKLNAQYPKLAIGLPSEAQWEYACRAGTTTHFCFGDDISPALARYASEGPVPVASLPPNKWGLYEMHGNVWEWCADPWHGNYHGAPSDGSVWDWPAGEGARRVVRGGAWAFSPDHLHAVFRFGFVPEGHDAIGFRCARVPEAPGAEAPDASSSFGLLALAIRRASFGPSR